MNKYADERIANPEKYYRDAEAVTKDASLSLEEKQRVLDSMNLDAELLTEATEEGMTGGEQPPSVENIRIARQKLVTTPGADPVAAFKNIVAALTGNEKMNEKIAQYAFKVASSGGCNVHLVNVIEPEEGLIQTAAGPAMGAPHIGMQIDQKLLEEEHAKRQSANEYIRRWWGSDVSGENVVAHGDPSSIVTDFASDQQADLIVIGATDRSWFEKLLGIAPTQVVAENASCPILVVPSA